jgi:hypothetical protein
LFVCVAATHTQLKALSSLLVNESRQYDQRESAQHEPPDAHTLWLWMDQDWRRWESDDPWHWDPEVRKQWAEDLLKQQAQRQREKERYNTRQQQQR